MKRSILFTLATLAFCTMAVQNATAESNLGLKRMGVTFGYVSPQNIDGTFGVSALADLGTVSPQFGIELHADRWSHSEEAFGTKATLSDLMVGARGKYMFQTSSTKIQPFIGAGMGMHFVHAEVSDTDMSVEDSATKLGLELGGGMDTSLSPRMDLRTELWYGFASDIDQLAMRVGFAWKM